MLGVCILFVIVCITLKIIIKCMNYEIELDDLEETSVCEEMNGPGNLLGYCVLTKRIREIHVQKVLRNLVYAMMEHVDPSGLKN